MIRSLSRHAYIGAGLIVAGAVLLLAEAHVVRADWHVVFWAAVACLGAYRVVVAFMQHGSGMFLGTLVTGIGVYKVLTLYDILSIPSYLIPAALLALLGAGFVMTFIASPQRWHLLIPGAVLLAVSFLMIMVEEGYYDRWQVVDSIAQWWPIALIVFGIALLLNRREGRLPWSKEEQSPAPPTDAPKPG